jgi:DNA-binding transcriptional LysR family regulator
MELRHLRYAITVAEELHFTRAAARLGIGQPPLSQQIKQLEDELGTRLFARMSRGVTLTEAGRAFLPHAAAAIREAERAVAAAQRAARGELGRIRIGFTSSASFNPRVPGIIGRFREEYPGVQVFLTEQTTSSLLVGLREETIDVAFLRPAQDETEGLVTRTLPAEALWVALPARHPLARRTQVDLIELAGDAFVLYPRANGRLLYDTIIAACRNAGFSPRIAQEAPQMASTVNLVAAGVGVAMVPESMCQLHAQGVVYARIAGDPPGATLTIAHRAEMTRTKVIENFIGCLSSSG